SAVVDNYEAYRDYNATTTHSDYGENLYTLLDFLALRARYDRQARQPRPLYLVHQVLVRQGRAQPARLWQGECPRQTQQVAAEYLEELAELERTHGMRLSTVADHMGERFVRPLVLDRLCALVEPAVEEAGRGQEGEALAEFERELQPLAAEP